MRALRCFNRRRSNCSVLTMEYEPADRSSRVARRGCALSYPIAADRLEFVPVGYASTCYRLYAGDEPLYFLKVWPDRARRCGEMVRAGDQLPRAATPGHVRGVGW